MVIYQIASGLPRSFGVRIVKTISPLTNRTLLIYTPFNPRLVTTSYFVSFSLPNTVCFAVVVVGTIFLISKFKSSRRLRDSMTKSGKSLSNISEKDIKLVRSMIFVCCIYIIGSAAGVVIYIVSTAYPTLQGDNPYLGTLITAFIVHANLFQAVSCSVNILVYFRMGSKFKKTFFQLFFCRSK